ncbi:MAG: SDR family oxidoreductase [Candidatus Diapherotrites archaeon]|nr:SDR family oxidoreductase [Candidatus Diapherotrites archaeon]
MKTAVVTGAAGFIGSHLCDALLEHGFRVIGVDNLITGNRANIAHLLKNKRFSFVKKDIVKGFDAKGKFDFVFNLASPASPVDYQKIPMETILANSIGTKNMLDFALKKKAVFVEASTSEVYGDPLQHPQRETYNGNVSITGPRACYDESKRFGEMLSAYYGSKLGLKVRIARIFNTYGPRMRANDGRVIPNFITQALAGKPLTVYGDGRQTRSFCYVSDLIEGLLKLAFSNYDRPVNLGNPEEMTMLEMTEKIRALTGSKSDIFFMALPEDDPARRKPDISVAERELGWKPRVSTEEGLRKTIEFFKKNKK